ncbi:hypothetical protein QT986_01060 [Microcoleus sp. herbarium14]
MARQLIMAIAESAESLEQQLKNSRTASQKERLQMLWWLKTGQITQHKTLAERLGRDGSTVTGVAAKVSPGRIIRIVGSQKCTRKIASLKSRGDRRITRKTGTATRIQELWGNCGVAQSDLSTEPDISHSLSLGPLPT